MSNLVGWMFLALVLIDAVITYVEPDWIETWDFYFGLAYISITVLSASYFIATDDIDGAVIFLIIAIAYGILWWNHTNKRRKKMADRAAGMVVDMGGRLKVVHEPVTE